MALQLLTHELKVEVDFGPRLFFAFLAFAWLALPPTAATGETDTDHPGTLLLSEHDSYAVPSGVVSSLYVPGSGAVPTCPGMQDGTTGCAAVLGRANSTVTKQTTSLTVSPNNSANLGIGTASPNALVHVAGHVEPGGCFWLGGTVRCYW